MISLKALPSLEPDHAGGGEIVVWMGKPFDYYTPFRAVVNEITEALGPDSSSSLRLPSPEAFEDFVEGHLEFNGRPIFLYWEHSLSYLSLRSDSFGILREVEHSLLPLVQIEG